MKRLIFCIVAFVCSFILGFTKEIEMKRETKNGTVEGFAIHNTATVAWLGIPYAKPPLGNLRWKAPREPENWEGVLDAKKFKLKSFQGKNKSTSGTEDSLYLNIYRPASDKTNLPVLVYIHGGGNTSGSGNGYYRNELVEQINGIVVTVNYRLNALGWFSHPALRTGNSLDDSGNYGFLDIIQALKWIKENITAFGGDENNVTVLGQSAGGRNVLALAISPLAEGLFHKLVVLSGGTTLSTREAGDKKANEIIIKILIKDKIVKDINEGEQWLKNRSSEEIAMYLRNKTPEEIWNQYPAGILSLQDFPHLFKDGYVIPEEGYELFERGEYEKVPMILGTTGQEFISFLYKQNMFGVVQSVDFKNELFKTEEMMKLWKIISKYGNKIYANFNGENIAKRLIMNLDQPPVYMYRFNWGMRKGVLNEKNRIINGGKHSMDLNFLFSEWKKPGYEEINTFENEGGRLALANSYNRYLKNFLHTGDPNGEGLVRWKKWSREPGKKLLVMDADKDKAVIEMSEEMLEREKILEEFENHFDKDTRKNIVDKVFKKRFFYTVFD